MKLSERIICKELCRHYNITIPISSKTELSLGRPYICETTQEHLTGHILICKNDIQSLLESKSMTDNFILHVSGGNAFPTYASSNVLELPETTDVFELCNFLQSIFDHYDDWDESLHEMMKLSEPLSALLDASFSIFNNPLILRASDYFMLAHSSVIDENSSLSHLVDPSANFENMTTCKLDPLYNQAKYNTEPFFLPEYLTGSRELCINLFEHKIFSYRLVVAEELQQIDTDMAPLLEHLSYYIGLCLSRIEPDNGHAGYSLEHLLRDVIDNKITDLTLLGNRFSEYGWLSTHDYCCFSLKTAALDRQNLTAKYICHHFEDIIKGSCAFQKEEDIIVFVNLTRFGKSEEELVTSCIEFLRDSFLKAGISNTFHGTYDLYYCCMQSRIALDIGTRHQPYHWIHKFEKLSLLWLLENATGSMPVPYACSGKIFALKRYDIIHKSDYCKTMEVYLKNHMNAMAAARQLFIHRSTFLYRLDRIKEIAGVDFEDENMLFYLELSYRIIESEGNVSMESFEDHKIKNK